jgi:RHS repeat-associated protein
VSYAGYAQAYGGGYAARLHTVLLPGCALTTPNVPTCRRQTAIPSVNDIRDRTLTAPVTVPGSVPLVVALTSGPTGSEGDFTGTALSEAGQWTSGGSNGSFDYSYPFQVPPVPGGLEPKIALAYDSQSVDGLTSATNNQASWAGDGWDYSPGYVEESYASCENTPVPAPAPSLGWVKSGDFCYSQYDTVTLSLNGQDTTLVDDPKTGWHPEVDNGERVRYLTDTWNGTNDNGYWVITTTDGTSYYFGRDHLPGWTSSSTPTDSAWTMPVYATQPGQCGYDTTYSSSSYCPDAAWRWNLDWVTDTHGDAIAYYYTHETNYYSRFDGSKADTSYIRGGVLTKIDYGLRSDNAYASPTAEVTFDASAVRTDIPSDLECASGATCSVISPTFWTKYELNSVTTAALDGGSMTTADTWTLHYTYPPTNDATTPDPSLWLASVTHTAGEGGTATSLPPTEFAGKADPNRIIAEENDPGSLITRYRLTSITNETGDLTSIDYLAPSGACTSGTLPSEDADTLRCYPAYWDEPGYSNPQESWFNKYAVDEVSQQDAYSTADTVTTYGYGGAAWHYDDDALTRSAQRTWDQWRGFRTVTTRTGPASSPDTEVTDTYFQGMDGDHLATGGTRSVTLTSSVGGDTVTDSGQFAGMLFEHETDNGPSGAMVTDTVTLPWASPATATQSQPSPLPPLTAYLTGTAQTKTYTALASGGNRLSTLTYTHDGYGRVTTVSSVPDTSNASQDTCTTTTYASSTSEWLLDLPAQVQVVSVPCGTTPSLPADSVSDTLTLYDGASYDPANWPGADTPAAGDVTGTELATGYSGSTPVFTTESQATDDQYGRILASTDADSRTTTTGYTPATGAEPVSVSVTQPQPSAADTTVLKTTTTYNPLRDLPLTVINPAGWVTTRQYDELGRLTAAWTPGHGPAGPAQYKYSYSICDYSQPNADCSTSPPLVTTQTIEPEGTGYLTSETIYDSLGRVKETQSETFDGNTDVTDIFYNSDGWKAKESNPYYISGAPVPHLVTAADDKVPSQTVWIYDGTGRVKAVQSLSLAVESWETDYTYGGNYVTTSYQNLKTGEPDGGTPQTVFTDGRGLTTAIYQYHSGVPASPADPASDYDETDYTYTPAGQLAGITDPAGNTWAYTYNLDGTRASATTPDSGTTDYTYDAAGQLTSQKDARDDQVSFTYDNDGRKTAEYDTTDGAAETSADQIASWTWDTLAAGQLTSSTSYYNGGADQYTVSQMGYNGYGLSTGTVTTIGSGPLAGTYYHELFYNPFDGIQTSYADTANGGLPKETVGWSLNNAGEQTSVGGGWAYVNSLTWTELGQPSLYTYGSTGAPAWTYDFYDPQTYALSRQETETGTTPAVVDDLNYSYDNTGQLYKVADTPPAAVGATNVQCFDYDYLGRISQAWSQSAQACTTPSASAEASAAAPYWDQYSYNTENDLTKVAVTSIAGELVTTTIGYGTTSAGYAGPHAVSTQTTGLGTTSYVYDAAGHLTQATGATSRTYTWDHAGRLSADGGTSYIYDADGNLLITQSASGIATLHLADEDITVKTANGATTNLSATRYYSIAGQIAASMTVTTSNGLASTSIDYLTSDIAGTPTLAIDSVSLALTRRWYDPYGNPVSSAGTWNGDRGFENGALDTGTGLTNLGAREYNPATGSFISTDPLLKPYDPQDLNPYAYSENTPPTGEDPTGQMIVGCGDNCTGTGDGNGSGNGGGNNGNRGGPGRTSPGNSDGIVQISQNVYIDANAPQARVLQVAWVTISREYPHAGEFSNWWHMCAQYASLCTGQFGSSFRSLTPNSSMEGAWASGISVVLTSGLQIGAILVPLRGPLPGPVQPYEVGLYKDLKARSVAGDELDIHHIPQGNPAGQVIEGYDYINAPAMALPAGEHRDIPTQRGDYSGTPQELIEQNLQELRDYTGAPETQIQAIRDLINSTYPGILDGQGGDGGGEGGAGGE